MMGVEAALCVLLLCGGFICTLGDKHSLYYLYTIQSKSSSEFSVVTRLDDRQIDSYSSTDGIRTPKQDWLKKINVTEWKEGTDKLKYDGQQLNQILDNQMKAFQHNASDDHVLQWKNGCEGEKSSDGSVSVLNCISEYRYDKQDLISYNWTSQKWSASVIQAKQMEEEWNRGPGDQKCDECVDWLKIYLQYSTQERPFSNTSLGLIIGGAIAGFIVLLAVLVVLVRRNILKKKSADPKNLEVVKTTSTSVNVKWEKARGEIVRYILLASPQRDGSAVSLQIEVSSGEDSAVINCLEPGCLYEISLCAEKNSKQSRKLTIQATTEPKPGGSVSCSDSGVESESTNNSSRENITPNSESSSNTVNGDGVNTEDQTNAAMSQNFNPWQADVTKYCYGSRLNLSNM